MIPNQDAERQASGAMVYRVVAVLRNDRSAGILLASAALAFAALGALVLVSESSLLRFDRAAERVLLGIRVGWLDRAMIWLTFLGTRYVIAAGSLALLVWSHFRKRHRMFVLVIVAAVLLNPLFEVGFKELIDRVRPAVDQLLPGNGPSFPSGHVLAAVGFYGLLPLLAWEATRHRWARIGAFLGSTIVVFVVTVSRPYLDVHWTSDAMAGMLLGLVLVVVAYHIYLRLAARAPAG